MTAAASPVAIAPTAVRGSTPAFGSTTEPGEDTAFPVLGEFDALEQPRTATGGEVPMSQASTDWSAGDQPEPEPMALWGPTAHDAAVATAQADVATDNVELDVDARRAALTALRNGPGAQTPGPGGATHDAARAATPTPDTPNLAETAAAARAAGTAATTGDGNPARTLALLAESLERPVRMTPAAPTVAPVLPDAVLAPSLAPPPAPAAREWLPGTLQLPTQRSPDGNETAEQLNARLNWMANNQVQRAQIRISPPRLGSVEIDIQVRDNTVRAEFGASSAEARAALEAGLPRLREMFAAQGMTFTHGEVGSSLSQGSGQGEAQARQGHGEGRQAPVPPGEREHMAQGRPEDTPARPRSGHGLLDEYA